MPDLTVEDRLTLLENFAHQYLEQIPQEMRKQMEGNARLDALTQFALETAEQSGLSKEVFLSRFAANFRWYYDRLMQISGDIDPNLAGHIDDRAIGDVSTEEHPPPIFPPK